MNKKSQLILLIAILFAFLATTTGQSCVNLDIGCCGKTFGFWDKEYFHTPCNDYCGFELYGCCANNIGNAVCYDPCRRYYK
ncbi:hypothetical protein Anas_09301 [Armadillidium nasatum]|uniref:Uncharacterized protein n=1 Tax=Armadillidium nasatum TaxID=96803 RepID=A0A5N5STW8_9CRUS|nr:hypothetical protein Anas_09301 [Armadillidium nasatum]